ncbi:PrsW family glutamic-type intramembrane protease [Treponema sp. HNW]|uniref:PrsW family glutamic-type intramembrane protease n=1 Tax=Treponema sp. HNW TaxID=3116654 RepID=UPI003D09B5C4
MELYIKLGLSFLPLVPLLYAAAVKVSGFRLNHILWAGAAGFAALVPIIGLQFISERFFSFNASSLWAVFFGALLFNGVIEEGSKAFFLFLVPIKDGSRAVGLTSALIAGTTVGSFETLIYCIAGTNYSILRLCTAVILHSLCAGLSYFFVLSVKESKEKKQQGSAQGYRVRLMPFFTAVFCHGIYNFFAGFSGFLWSFSVFALLFALIRVRFYYGED